MLFWPDHNVKNNIITNITGIKESLLKKLFIEIADIIKKRGNNGNIYLGITIVAETNKNNAKNTGIKLIFDFIFIS